MIEATMDDPSRLVFGRHFAGTLTRMVLDHLANHLGNESVESWLVRTGEARSLAELRDDSSWSSYAQFRSLLEAAAVALGGTERLTDIGRDAAVAAGSMPGTTEAMQRLGSPSALFAQMAEGQNGIITVLDVEMVELGPTEWALRSRFKEGFEPFRAFCSFTMGLDRLAPTLFGFSDIEVVEETCQCHGDAWCTMIVRWHSGDDTARAVAYLETRLRLSEMRLEEFQRTVAELVSADDLDTVLTRVVHAAARATRAPAFVLALEPLPWATNCVFAEGIDDRRARVVAADALAMASPEDMTGGMAVDVVSTRRRYGRLIAIDPDQSVLQHERVLLEGYARLAASALDSATALEDARRQAKIAHALLELSASLAVIATTDEMAASLARAIPDVIDCDQSFVVLVDRATSTARVVAAQGFEHSFSSLIAFEASVTSDSSESAVRVYETGSSSEIADTFLTKTGLVAMAIVPVTVNGSAAGYLVAGVLREPRRLALNVDLRERLLGLAGQASVALRNTLLVEQIRFQASHDGLTGLPNRMLALDRAEAMMARATRGQSACAALFIDLDGFKFVNDTLGHAAGDQLLLAVAERLSATSRAGDTVARLGGDEFVMLCEGPSIEAGVESVAERLLAVLREPYPLDAAAEGTVTLTASIGIARGARTTANDLINDADAAMYRAKAAGKDCFAVFAADDPVHGQR